MSHTPELESHQLNDSLLPATWNNGQILTYGDCTSHPDSPNWHQSTFDCNPRANHLSSVKLKDISILNQPKVKENDHSWIGSNIRATHQ